MNYCKTQPVDTRRLERLFGFGTNILVNLLTLTALLRFALKMPDELVF